MTRLFSSIYIVLCLLLSAPLCAATIRVTSLTGRADYSKDGKEWLPLGVDMLLDEGDTVMTKFNSYLTLNINGNICSVSPLTRICVQNLSEREAEGGRSLTKTVVTIDTGKAAFKVNSTDKKLNDFKVKTPANVSSVRGTEFVVYANGRLTTISGLVGTSSDRNYSVNAAVVSDGSETTAFSSTQSVGGGEVPVFAGNTVELDERTELYGMLRETQEKIRSFLPGSTSYLSDRERAAPQRLFDDTVRGPSRRGEYSAEGARRGELSADGTSSETVAEAAPDSPHDDDVTQTVDVGVTVTVPGN